MARRRMVSTQVADFTTPGITYVGKLVSKGRQTLEFGECGRYELDHAEGHYVINGTVQLDEALARVEVGETVEILYKGTVKTSAGFEVRQFEVYVLEEEPTPRRKRGT